jgi:hypothetical protein
MMNVQKLRFVGPTALACICAALAVLTGIWPEWIEGVFGVDPDQHSGWFEWLIVLGFAMVASMSALVARFEWGRSPHRA